jgi:hypothetical protein
MTKRKPLDRGSALLLTTILGLMVIGVGAAFFTYVLGHSRLQESLIRGRDALLVAEAGVVRTVHELRSGIDLDKNGTKEIVYGVQDGTVQALSPAGRVVWTFQRRGHISGSVLVGDLDRADSALEVFAGSHNGFVYLLGPRGQLKWEFQPGGRLAYMGITAEDIDGDGLVEVLINNDENLYSFSRPPAR